MEGASTVISSTDFSAVLDAIKAQISVGTIVEVLAVAVGASVGFVFMWWGINKLKGAIMNGVRKGRL